MLLYVSNATAYPLFDKLFADGKINSGYQMQKFNSNLIEGLSLYEELKAVSVLPYQDVNAGSIVETYHNVEYTCVPSVKGLLHKPMNVIACIAAMLKISRREKPRCIVVDAVAKAPLYASIAVGRMLRIPVIGIVTDFLGMLNPDDSENMQPNPGRMGECDAFILLTEQMNDVVNPHGKPYIVVEGLAANSLPDLGVTRKADGKTIFLYSGSLWKKLAGIEYFVEGFLSANIPGAELHLYGTGELVPWIQEVGKVHPCVKYMGCVPNEKMVKLQCDADFLVNPRPSTGAFCKYSFPSKTIEYMTSGTPVIMTYLPGVPDEYFDYVLAIDPETPSGAKASIEQACSIDLNTRNQMGVKARRFIEDNKSARLQAKRVVSFCDELLGGL